MYVKYFLKLMKHLSRISRNFFQVFSQFSLHTQSNRLVKGLMKKYTNNAIYTTLTVLFRYRIFHYYHKLLH